MPGDYEDDSQMRRSSLVDNLDADWTLPDALAKLSAKAGYAAGAEETMELHSGLMIIDLSIIVVDFRVHCRFNNSPDQIVATRRRDDLENMCGSI